MSVSRISLVDRSGRAEREAWSGEVEVRRGRGREESGVTEVESRSKSGER